MGTALRRRRRRRSIASVLCCVGRCTNAKPGPERKYHLIILRFNVIMYHVIDCAPCACARRSCTSNIARAMRNLFAFGWRMLLLKIACNAYLYTLHAHTRTYTHTTKSRDICGRRTKTTRKDTHTHTRMSIGACAILSSYRMRHHIAVVAAWPLACASLWKFC